MDILQQHLDQLLNAYSHICDLEGEVSAEGITFPASAHYYLRDETYLISKQHVLSAVEQHEYLYFYLTDRLSADDLREKADLAKRLGLPRVKPHKDHMFSNVGLVILANTIDPEAAKLIRHTRFRKNYALSFHGWTEFQLAAMDVTNNCFYSNPAGKGARKILEQNFAPKGKA